MSAERIATLTADLQASPAWNNRTDPALEERFRRVKAKLLGYTATAPVTLAAFPEGDHSVYGRYARGYAYHKAGFPEKADAESAALVAARPHAP